MKRPLLLTLILLFGLVGCDKTTTVTKSGSDDSANTSNNGGGGSNNNGGGGNNGGGVGPGAPLIELDLMLSGHQHWVPGNYTNNLQKETNINLEEAHYIFRSDSRLKVRFRVDSQPSPPTGEKYCYDRALGQPSDPYKYTKLKFTVYLRDLVCNQLDPNDSSKCLNFSLGYRYRPQTVGPINVGSYSQVLNLSNIRNNNQWGTVVEVAYVNSDSTCQSNGTYCPAEKTVRESSCWKMLMQVSTDYTQDMQ